MITGIWKRSSRLFTVGLVLLAIAALIALGYRSIPVTHAAATPTIVNSTSVSCNSSCGDALEVTLPGVVSGNDILLLISVGGGNDWEIQPVGGFTQLAFANDGLYDYSAIYVQQANVSGDTKYEVALTQLNWCPTCSTFVQWNMAVVQVSGQSTSEWDSGHDTLVQNGTGGTSHVTNSSALGTGNDDLDLAVYTDAGSNTTLSVPSGESQLGYKQDGTVNMQYDTASGDAVSHFEFDTSSGAAYSAVAAVSLASA